MKKGRKAAVSGLLVLSLALAAGCGNGKTADKAEQGGKKLTDIKVVLDWTPNTNHTGLYVAKEKGYYEQEGLNVQIIEPGAGGADQMVASGEVPFGVSYQEGLTYARTQGVPLVALAAVIQHNTSGLASPVAKNIKSPKDFEGKIYGGYGGPSEEAVVRSLTELDGGDPDKVKIVNIGEADYFTAVKKDVDFSWIYYAWTGVEAELRNEPLNMIYINQFSDKLDYYTPLIVTNEKMIANQPDIVKAFMAGTSKGYEYSIDHPDEAADILIKAAPDLDAALVKASQKWLSPRYKDDAAQWGLMKQEVFEGYTDWMMEHKLLETKPDMSKAFTDKFLPGQE
ncbi:ABC transporter substrate-binding protein [Gorillibacterium massiliense]|uniref:ABC transporter substrate-binding protein n=1 Tax=Gorillibacterium massiliense TaxID=1280390 RepID=UPI0004B95959|nr:ABC transporter substrate-binding protein [Gorillibacterium massiliense]